MILGFIQFFSKKKMKLILSKRTFTDVYGPDYTPTDYTGLNYTERLIINENNVYVHDCVFYCCSSDSDGGALYCNYRVYRMLVEKSSFISCKTSSFNGGGIYFWSSSNGECVLSRICGFNCSSINSATDGTTAVGPFGYIYTKNNNTYRNHVNDSSITHTLKECKYSCYSLYLYNGNILCQSVNLTNNECFGRTALYCSHIGSTESDTHCISYSSIVNNTANGSYSCIWFSTSDYSQLIDTCNILNNEQTSYSTYGTIVTYGNLFIKDSCILGNNKGKKVFYASSSYMITISNCTIDDDIISKTRYVGSFTVNKTIERTFSNAFSHIAPQGCDSYITLKPKVPSQSSRYLIFYNIKKTIINTLRNMQFIFLYTFLPSDPSNTHYFDSNCIFASGFCK
jgi:hypothetical protein